MINNNRKRTENWSKEEKKVLLKLVQPSASILENKNTDAYTNKLKIDEWDRIAKRFHEVTGCKKDVVQIKGLWRRMKIAAKKKVSNHQKEISSSEEPTVEELIPKILKTIANDIKVEENKLDSDGSSQANTEEDIPEELEEIPTPITSTPPTPLKMISFRKEPMKKTTDKGLPEYKLEILEANNIFKEKTFRIIEEESTLKKNFLQMYHKKELEHQEMKHKLELGNILLERKRLEMELEICKKKLDNKIP